MRDKVYLAGPMSGLPDHNYPAFLRAATELRDQGFFVCCPAELNPPDVSYRQALAVDLAWIIAHAALMVILPDWQNSKGVAVELALARAIGIPIYTTHWSNPVARSGLILEPML